MRPILLFIHGAGGSSKIWEHQMKLFSHAIAIDLPGHGAGKGKNTIDEYVEVVKEFCDENGLKDFVIVGHSMGGAIALKFALDYPEYLRAMVLVCTGARLRVAPIIFETLKSNYAHAVELMTEFLCDKAADEVKLKVKDEMIKINAEVVYGDFEACDKFDVMNRLNEVKVPTLIVCGLEDRLTPLKYAQYLKYNIPNSKLEIIADTGHMVMLEKPDEFNKKLAEFIKELSER